MQVEFHTFSDAELSTKADKVLQKADNDSETLHVQDAILIDGERRKVHTVSLQGVTGAARLNAVTTGTQDSHRTPYTTRSLYLTGTTASPSRNLMSTTA